MAFVPMGFLLVLRNESEFIQVILSEARHSGKRSMQQMKSGNLLG
jgi:hypothetical protein